MSVVRITKNNLHLFNNFMNNQKDEFECFIIPQISQLIHLIDTNNVYIYCLVEKENVLAIYVFKNTFFYFKNKLCIELITSISNTYYNENFVEGFLISLKKCKNSTEADIILIENSSHSPRLNIDQSTSITNQTISFYIYNYRYSTIKSSKVVLIY